MSGLRRTADLPLISSFFGSGPFADVATSMGPAPAEAFRRDVTMRCPSFEYDTVNT
jgi:hypothetical protein